MTRPNPDEYDPYYATYINLVPDGDVLATLRSGIDETQGLLAHKTDAFGDHRYAPGKWTVREVLSHLADAERTFGFRAFWFARKGAGPLPSFDPDPFVVEARAASRSITGLFDEWRAVRAANVALFETLDDEASRRSGIASGRTFSVRTFPWIAAGHEIHHRQHLKERYLA